MAFELRQSVWEIIKPLTEDADPTPEDEAIFGGSNMDPVTYSINTTRGEAMHTLVKYALWVRRHFEKQADADRLVSRGFDEMPEVREVLDIHLNPERDPSLAIRAVYGQGFPHLFLLDPRWAGNNVSRIFPREPGMEALRDAAWEAYILWCKPYDDVANILAEEYKGAIDRIGSGSSDDRRRADVDKHLAEHLVLLYTRGKLDYDEPGGLLQRFYSKATGEIRKRAFEFIGADIYKYPVPLQDATVERLRQLWIRRMREATRAQSIEEFLPEMIPFGWWFASGKFDDVWAMEQLKAVVKLAGKVMLSWRVVERLAEIAKSRPLDALECLRVMIQADREGLEIYGWRKHARTLLSTALETSDEKTRRSAEDLVDRLIQRGHLDFRDLLRRQEQ